MEHGKSGNGDDDPLASQGLPPGNDGKRVTARDPPDQETYEEKNG